MEKIQCCYKIIFADGSFYIGSTTNLKARICLHKSDMKNGSGFWGLFYPSITPADISKVEILLKDNTLKTVRQFENKQIHDNSGNPLMLNKPKGSRKYTGPTMREIYLNRKPNQ